MKYVAAELSRKRIPKCEYSNRECNQELTAANLRRFMEDIASIQKAIENLDILHYKRNKFECVHCKDWHEIETRFLWSICGHEYCAKCVQGYINSILGTKSSVLNVFYDQRVMCCVDGCDEKITMRDATKVGISVYQKYILSQNSEKGDDCVMM